MRPIVSTIKNTINNITGKKDADAAAKVEKKEPDVGMYEVSPVKVDALKLDEQVNLSIKAMPVEGNGNQTDVLISIQTPQGADRCPQDVICIVDFSGSMGDAATMTAADGSVESHGMCLLDIVGHAVRTVAASLGEEDRMALVLFDDRVETPFSLQSMTKAAKKNLVDEVAKLRPRGGTQVWEGLKEGLDILEKAPKLPGRRNNSLILLTDGETSGDPFAELKTYQEKHEGQFPGTVMTFGFGYNMNSTLLDNLSQLGGGMYCFIPDASIVGTAFVNCVSNLQSTFANQVILSIEPQEGVKLVGNTQVGSLPQQKTSWGLRFDLSTLQYGQTKDVVVRLEGVPSNVTESFLSASLAYTNGKDQVKIVAEATESPSADNAKDILVQRFRLESVDVIREKKEKRRLAFSSDLQNSSVKNDERIQALLKDIDGQVKEGLEDKYLQKWGRHFLPSIAKAHQAQQCNNFKDPGVQVYGGQMFNKIRDHLDEIFIKLAPPTPTLNSYGYGGYGGGYGSSAASSAPINMSNYYNACGGCFHGSSRAQMSNGNLKKVGEIVKGDQVSTSSGSSKVSCVLKTVYPSKTAQLVTLGDLKLTPYHPVKSEGVWTFPRDLSNPKTEECEAVYSFLLEDGTSMMIEGIECVSLAHGLNDNSVVAHSFFGTSKIVEDMRKFEGFESGLVTVFPHNFVRDPVSQSVIGLSSSLPSKEIRQSSELNAEQIAC
eukprot:TRINITY_DN30_c0_g2_i1.p1 TRINITY_DN30_c0_g2~~TRINITY_DN30_c0_g2_i1.p1  ORF type:complete len:716 (-),score=297.14 TRINITY_DN30_c0_g2_i1:41-2188(-)